MESSSNDGRVLAYEPARVACAWRRSNRRLAAVQNGGRTHMIAYIALLAQLTVAGILVTIVFMALTSFVFISLGLLIASMINNIEGFQVIVNFLVMPMFFLSGAIFPIGSATPLWMQIISAIDPLTYGVAGMRAALLGINAGAIYMDMGIMLVLSAVFIIIADWAFSRMQAQ